IGDIVVRKSYGRDITFKVIDVREKNGRENIILKGINIVVYKLLNKFPYNRYLHQHEVFYQVFQIQV
ncbi:Sporulation peptidase YabG, partial [human gut metagenome]